MDQIHVYGNSYTYTFDAFEPIIPGGKVFISIQEESQSDQCEYEISASLVETCDDQVPLGITSNYTTGCADYIMIEHSDDTHDGTLGNNEMHTFRTDFPENVARAWIRVESDADHLYFRVGYPVAYDTNSNVGGTYDASINKYVMYYQVTAPIYGTNYWTLFSYEGVSYSAAFHWDVCGDDQTGSAEEIPAPDGENPNDCFNEQISITLPDSFPIIKTIKNVYNPSIYTYAGTNILFKVPFGTTGYVNISCETSDMSTDSWLALSTGGQMVNCEKNYYNSISCNMYNTGNLLFLSNTLYGGGYWSLKLCTRVQEESAIDFTLTMNGMVVILIQYNRKTGRKWKNVAFRN